MPLSACQSNNHKTLCSWQEHDQNVTQELGDIRLKLSCSFSLHLIIYSTDFEIINSIDHASASGRESKLVGPNTTT